jgi:hypothetical protein
VVAHLGRPTSWNCGVSIQQLSWSKSVKQRDPS